MYLNELHQRSKRKTGRENMMEDDSVIVKDDNEASTSWEPADLHKCFQELRTKRWISDSW